jgi:hypothetical protein
VGLYAFLERFLNLVIEHPRAGGAAIPPSQMGLTLHKMRDHLAEFAKINMNRPPFDWQAAEKLSSEGSSTYFAMVSVKIRWQ